MPRKVKAKVLGPIRVDAIDASERAATEKKVASNPPQSQAKKTTPAVEVGEPDHSRVPLAPKRLLEPKEFFAFWHSIPQRERDAWFIAYAYRKMPICDPLQPLTEDELRAIQKKQRKAPEANCGKFTEPFNPDVWESEVYQKWGAGDYQIRLNDQHPSVKDTVCECHIRGLREWDKYPPILKVEEVVLSEHLNQPYLRWARLHGIKFPGDPGYGGSETSEQENDDMAAQASVEKLTDALIEVTSRPQPVHQAPTVAAPDRSNEILADAALKGQQILLDSIKAQGKAQDPMEFHRAVTEAAKAMVPPPAVATSAGPSLTELMALMTQMMAPLMQANTAMLEMERSRTAAAERRMESLETRLMQQAAPAVPPSVAPEVGNPVKNAMDLLKGLVALKDQAGSLLGGSEAAADADMPVWARIASKVLDHAPGMLYNAAVMRSGQGQPVAPGELNPEVVDREQPEQLAPAAVEEGGVFSDRRMAEEIAGPLIQALNDQRKGFEFAAGLILTPRVMGFPGRVVYEMAVDQGQDGMYRILQSHAGLWAQLVRIPQQFQQFMLEFLDRNAAYAVVEAAKNPPAVPVAQVEVMPPERPNGRTVVNPATGKPVHTAPVVE